MVVAVAVAATVVFGLVDLFVVVLVVAVFVVMLVEGEGVLVAPALALLAMVNFESSSDR